MTTFFPPVEPILVSALADLLGLELRAEKGEDVTLSSVAPLESASVGALTFLNNRSYARLLADTKASAVIVSARDAEQVPASIAALISPDPYRSFAQAAALLVPSAMRPLPVIEDGISDRAVVHETAILEQDVTVEAGAVIGARARIGRGTLIGPNVTIGADVHIGRDCSIVANASIIHALLGDRVIIQAGARIGCDGFGFSMGPQGHLKIPQLGRAVLQDDVEVGPNSVIDRGSNRDTVVGEGSKIDGAVMIGHNTTIGRHCVLAGQAGVAGSSTLGDFVVMGAGVSVNGHITIASGAQFMGKTVVVEDVKQAGQYAGDPARPLKLWRRDMVRTRRELKKRVAEMEGHKTDE